MLVADDAIDETFFTETISKQEARRKLGIPEDEFVVMYIGGLAAWKGVNTFYKGAAKMSTAQFYVIGGTG